MRKIFAIMFGIMSMCQCSILLAKENMKDHYNYQRAMEFWRKDDDKCMEWLQKEISDCPKNGFAHYRLSALFRKSKEYGQALTASNQAIELLKKEKDWNAYAYLERAYVYNCLADTASALTDMGTAIRLAPKESDLYEERGDLLYELHRYDEAAKDFQAYIDLKPGDSYGYMALGRNALDQDSLDEAVRQFTYCTKLSTSYARAYSFRAEAYIKQGKWREAIDDVINTILLDSRDNKVYGTLTTLADSSYTLLTIKMKAQQKKDPSKVMWPLLLAQVCDHTRHYSEALKYNQIAYDITGEAYAAKLLANSYSILGNYPKSLELIERACDIDTTDVEYVFTRAQMKMLASMYESALPDYDKYIEDNPDLAAAYVAKAECLDRMDSIDAALEVLELAFAHDPDAADANLLEGRLLTLKGEKAAAVPFLEKAIANDKDNPSKTHEMYAYLYLQRYDSLDAVQSRLLAKDVDHPNSNNLYNVACLYALRGDTAQCMSHLRQALDAGFINFNHARKDRDLVSLQGQDDFENLISTYEARFAEAQGIQIVLPSAEATMESDVTEIPFTKEGGVCKVKCTINDLPLYFVFDTGASDVTMSTVEATFMFKNDYLSRRDITGKEYYMTANGEISEGTTIVLKTVNFGGVTLTNVKASVVASQNAPLLLGQSVLSRLGHIEIDNQKKVIRIKK